MNNLSLFLKVLNKGRYLYAIPMPPKKKGFGEF